MKMEVYSVRDSATGAFLQPMFFRARGEALRTFAAAVEDTQHQFSKFAAYYTLFFLGEWDDNAGIFAVGEPQRVVSANECLGPDAVARPPAKVVS